MRFDLDRAMAHVRALDFPRYRGTAGLRRAADSVAEHFASAGLEVQRVEQPGTVRDLVARQVLLVIAPGPLALLTGLALPGRSLLEVLGLIFAWMVSLALGLILGRWWRREPGRSPRLGVLAFPLKSPQVPAQRMVILTRLDTPRERGRTYRRRGLLMLGIVVLGVTLLALALIRATQLAVLGPGLLLGCWFLSMLLVVEPWERGQPAFPGDNRSGLALLLELARIWPERLRDRIETVFGALDDSLMGQDAWPTLLPADPGPRRPTFRVVFQAPGAGPSPTLSGSGTTFEVASRAASDLWLPHRLGRPTWADSPDNRVFLRGDSDASEIDPAGLAATAQLVTEVALRLAREAADQPETRARSSQNSG